jgi:hypothetical protein
MMRNDTASLPRQRSATLAQARAILQHHLKLLWAQPDLALQVPPLMLWGPPGIGKSALVREICAAEGIDFIDVRLAQREPVDMRGLPVPRGDAVHWLPAAEWPRDPGSRGIILFDELTAADRALQVAAYEFILDRRLGNLYSVPPGWYLCGAGNRGGDRAVTVGMSSALANRLCHVELAPDLSSWTRWAIARGLHAAVIAFLRFRPECFFDMGGDLERGWPTPRTWERVSITLQQAERSGLDPMLVEIVIEGLVGMAAATEFAAFRSWAEALPDVEAMLNGRVPIQIPERADQRYAFCSALVHHLWRGDAPPHTVDGFLRITAAMSSDFAAMAMIDAATGTTPEQSRDRAERLFAHPRFATWAARHGATFAELQAA